MAQAQYPVSWGQRTSGSHGVAILVHVDSLLPWVALLIPHRNEPEGRRSRAYKGPTNFFEIAMRLKTGKLSPCSNNKPGLQRNLPALALRPAGPTPRKVLRLCGFAPTAIFL